MEIITKIKSDRLFLKAALFDFDGTISTLRYGWEKIMEPFMVEMIVGSGDVEKTIIQEVKEFIDKSTGIQTIHQMKWLSEKVEEYGKHKGETKDSWWYKKEYNKRLMKIVQKRKEEIYNGIKKPEDYMIKGSSKILKSLSKKGVLLFLASGTDDPDVKEEAKILGIAKYFEKISGAPLGKVNCSKKAVLQMLIKEYGLKGPEVIVIGDGKVEIDLARKVNALAIGLASDEEKGCGLNQIKRKRLIKAGAHAIIGDFDNIDSILRWSGF